MNRDGVDNLDGGVERGEVVETTLLPIPGTAVLTVPVSSAGNVSSTGLCLLKGVHERTAATG